jgi:hypothetical protein
VTRGRTGATRTAHAAAACALAAALTLVPGCLVLPWFTSARTGSLLEKEHVAALRAGTPRREVLERLGPPLAVGRRGDGAAPVPDVHLRRSGGAEQPASWFFDRFAGVAAGPRDVVYFYCEHELRTSGSGAIVAVGNKGALVGSSTDEDREDRLWILLDGETGLVKAHLHERDEPPPAQEAGDAASGEGDPGAAQWGTQ